MIRDLWNSITWAMNSSVAWVIDWLSSWWESNPLSLLGVVITITFALVVTFRHTS